MPDSLVAALHRYHPDAQIDVSSKHLDQAIVSSTLLRRLSVSIPCLDFTDPDLVAPFEHLRRILLRSPNLRTLVVDTHHDVNLLKAAVETTRSAEITTAQKIQIPLKQLDRLPALEELAFNARLYDFDREHCSHLLQCMDWSKLRTLTLRASNPTNFFDVFTGKIPVLEHLDITYHYWPRAFYPHPPHYYWNRPNHPDIPQDPLGNCSEFVSSLNLLKTIIIRCDVVNLSLLFWRRLAAIHGERLESFSLQSRHELYEEPIWQHPVSDFLVHFTALRHLDLTILYTSPGATLPCAYCTGHHLIVSSASHDSDSPLTPVEY
jgi:hypothetical protein